MRLLGSVSLGRVVFTARALPAIRPVTHLVDGDHVIIRTDRDAAITSVPPPIMGWTSTADSRAPNLPARAR